MEDFSEIVQDSFGKTLFFPSSPPHNQSRQDQDFLWTPSQTTPSGEKAGIVAGEVYFVGAGPGEPSLMTLRAAEILLMAEVVLHDRLVHPDILDRWVPESALRIDVGKQVGDNPWPQQMICDELRRWVASGKRVVRLKGGDSVLFGRLTEELEAVRPLGCWVEVVPGITAAQAAAADARISLTDRDWASAVTLVTGHSQRLEDGSWEAEEMGDRMAEWRQVATASGTLAIYMGRRLAQRWSQDLIDGGLSPATPLLVVHRAGCHDCQMDQGRLGRLAEGSWEPRLPPGPVVYLIGQVAAQASFPNSCSQTFPLQGCHLLWPRPFRDEDPLHDRLVQRGAMLWRDPAIEIVPLGLDEAGRGFVDGIDRYDWIFFTSVPGVDFFWQRLMDRGWDARKLHGVRLGVVGPSTAKALRDRGLLPDAMPTEEASAAALLESVRAQIAGQSVLWVRGDKGVDPFAEGLAEIAGRVDSLCLYRNIPKEQPNPLIASRLQSGAIDGVAVTSRSIAESLVHRYGEDLKRATLLAFSPLIAQRLKELGCDAAEVCSQATPDAFCELVTGWFRKERLARRTT
ncbi:MAG: uroporphyrinogen-III C-methyltransferase [Pirellulaceae bacterium]